MIRFLLRLPPWSLTAAAAAVILYLTLFPDPVPDTGVEIPGLDKVVHALMFGGLTMAMAVDYARRGRVIGSVSPSRLFLFALFSFVFGGGVEILQAVMDAGRSGDLWDLSADAAGAALFAVASRPLIAFIRKRQG